MNDRSNSGKPAAIAVIAVTAAALALRLIGLNSSSLTLNESENALSALRLFEGGSSAQLLYTLPTALFFRMFGVSDFSARLFPALAGTALALIPFLMQEKIGSRRAVLLAFLFAVDPVLLFWSKRADALIPAILAVTAAAAFYASGKGFLSAFFMLAALGGGSRFAPALPAVLAVWMNRNDLIPYGGRIKEVFGKKQTACAAAMFGLLIIMFGTLPSGISAYASGIAAFFRPAAAGEYPGAAAVLIALGIYCGIPLIVYLWRCASGGVYKNPLVMILCLAAMLLWKGMPALAWINWMLWVCVSDFILPGIIKKLEGPLNFPFWAAAGAVAGSYAFFYFRLVEVFNQQNGASPVQISFNGKLQTLPLTRVGASALLTLVSVVILGLIVKILLGFFDSLSIRRGLLCGCLIICSWGLAQNLWNNAGFDRIGDHPAAAHPGNSLNLLNGNYTAFTDTVLFEILDEIADKHGDAPNHIYGLNFITDDPLIEWTLYPIKGIRDENNIRADLSGIDMAVVPFGNPFEESGFVGTVIPYRSTIIWERYSIQDWGKWMLFGDGAPAEKASAVLWVKGNYIYSNEE